MGAYPGAALLPGTSTDYFLARRPIAMPLIPGIRFLGYQKGGWSQSGFFPIYSVWNQAENQECFSWGVLNTSKVAWYVSGDGSTSTLFQSTASIPANANGLGFTPAADYSTMQPLYTTDWGATWQTLGATVANTVTPFAVDPLVPMTVGTGRGSNYFQGSVSRLQLLALDGATLLADLNCQERSLWGEDGRSIDSCGNVWLRQGPTIKQFVQQAGPHPYYDVGSLPAASSFEDGQVAYEGSTPNQARGGSWVQVGSGSSSAYLYTDFTSSSASNPDGGSTAGSTLKTCTTIPAANLSVGQVYRMRTLGQLGAVAASGAFVWLVRPNGIQTAGTAMSMSVAPSQTKAGTLPLFLDVQLMILATGASGQIAWMGRYSKYAAAGTDTPTLFENISNTFDMSAGLYFDHRFNIPSAASGAGPNSAEIHHLSLKQEL